MEKLRLIIEDIIMYFRGDMNPNIANNQTRLQPPLASQKNKGN